MIWIHFWVSSQERARLRYRPVYRDDELLIEVFGDY